MFPAERPPGSHTLETLALVQILRATPGTLFQEGNIAPRVYLAWFQPFTPLKSSVSQKGREPGGHVTLPSAQETEAQGTAVVHQQATVSWWKAGN